MPIKTILFDLDGTLLQSVDVILGAFRDTFRTFLPDLELKEEDYSGFLGQTLFDTFGYYADETMVSAMIEHYRNVSDQAFEKELLAYPHAKETLSYLKQHGSTIGIVTSKMRHVALDHLRRIGLIELIDGLIGYEDVRKHKPDAEPIEKALNLFKAKPEETIYVGDHENDIRSAKAAGILSCAVTYSHRLREMLVLQPEYAIDDLVHLKDVI
ncbi:MAG: HAD-IA family hydrolase [Acholeplasmataceae bacterium]